MRLRRGDCWWFFSLRFVRERGRDFRAGFPDREVSRVLEWRFDVFVF